MGYPLHTAILIQKVGDKLPTSMSGFTNGGAEIRISRYGMVTLPVFNMVDEGEQHQIISLMKRCGSQYHSMGNWESIGTLTQSYSNLIGTLVSPFININICCINFIVDTCYVMLLWGQGPNNPRSGVIRKCASRTDKCSLFQIAVIQASDSLVSTWIPPLFTVTGISIVCATST